MGLAEEWRAKGVLSDARASRLEAVETGRVFSAHAELRGLLYLGAALFLAGVSAVVARHFDALGEVSIVAALALGAAACAWYCAPRTPPYSGGRVASPTAAYDYALYLGCALVGVLLGYLEARHHLLGRAWHFYLLGAAVLSFALAYRCDNRLVLSLGLLDLAAWYAAWVPHLEGRALEASAIVFGLGCAGAGRALAARGVKAHFEDAYMTVAAHSVCGALLPRVLAHGAASVEFWALLPAGAALLAYGWTGRRFAFLLYGAAYAYAAVTAAAFRLFDFGIMTGPLYFLFSAGAAVAALLAARRHLAEER